jgi:hypothetical protein
MVEIDLQFLIREQQCGFSGFDHVVDVESVPANGLGTTQSTLDEFGG